MAIHSSVLAWRIPGMGEPGGLPSIGLHRVGHDWSDLAVAGSWSQCSHSNDSGLDLEFCMGLYIFFCWSGTPLSQCSACTSVSEVYSRCIRGERRTPHPPTPLPSCPLRESCHSYHLLVETSSLLKISQIEFATRSVCHHIPCSLKHIFFLVLPNYK